jgi:hypothetical protein
MKYSESFTYPDIREKRVLAYATGAEFSDTIVLESSLGDDFTLTEPMTGKTVTGKKYVAGQLMAECLTEDEGGVVGRYAKYDPAATDGRGDTDGVAPSSLCVLKKDQVVTFGDVPAGAYRDFCVFDEAQLVGYEGNEPAVKAAMPRCRFVTVTRLD